jgi:hypothetical protein
MSYTIYYRKQFISIGQTINGETIYIPMVESGDNNVYESNRKRARDWNFRKDFTGNNPSATEKQMLQYATEAYYNYKSASERETLTEKEYQKNYGWHVGLAIKGSTTNTTWGSFLGIIKTGCKQAIPLKELPGGLKIWLPVYSWTEKQLLEHNKEVLAPIYVNTTEEYLEAFKKYNDYYGNDFHWCVDFNEEWVIDNIFRRRSWDNKDKRRNGYEYISTSKFFVLISNENNGTFVKNTKYGYKYSYYNTAGKLFLTEKDAKTFHNRMRNKDLFTVKEINLDGNTVTIKKKVKEIFVS